jgi:signal transduction histidine kinase
MPEANDRSRGPQYWRGWGNHRRGPGAPGFRPPWWPEGEPFPPPRGAEAWRDRRRYFVRRVAVFVGLFFLLLFGLSALAVWALLGLFGEDQRGFGPPIAILFAGLFVAFLLTGRAVRRTARPVGEVMEAADRVAAGDYTARVEERGPRELRRLARSFNEMAERLAANEEQRRNLLADVAHELRTPMTVIQGATEGMLDGVYPADPDHLEPVLDHTRVMARLLDDLQTLSTAEAGALRLHREPTEPDELVRDAVAAIRPRAEAARLRLETVVPSRLPALDVDPMRLGEVLANLLQNAVRHTPVGGSVSVAAEPDGDGVAFSVTDTGPGIPRELLDHVFDRFVKSADSGGAGLGLAIARSLVEAHGGTIAAESPPGGGTTIRFTMPAASSATR